MDPGNIYKYCNVRMSEKDYKSSNLSQIDAFSFSTDFRHNFLKWSLVYVVSNITEDITGDLSFRTSKYFGPATKIDSSLAVDLNKEEFYGF
jgi:hypothetical protein